MPITVLIRPGGTSSTLLPVTAQAVSITTTGATVTWTLPTNSTHVGIIIWRRSLTDANAQPNNLYTWRRQTFTPLPATATTFFDRYSIEGETYTYRIGTVDLTNTVSTFADATGLTPAWAPTGLLNVYSEDFNIPGPFGWIPDAGVTVTASAPGFLINFVAASKAITMNVPINPAGGRQLSMQFKLRAAIAGDVGKTVQLYMHSGGEFSADFQVTLAAADQVFTFVRPAFGAGNTGRFVIFGISTFGTATATQVIATYGALSPTLTPVAYVRSQAPGTIWQEPIDLNGTYYTAGATATYGGWHKSMANNTTPAINIGQQIDITLDGIRTFSRGGHHVNQASIQPTRISVIRAWHIGFHPLANGVAKGNYFNAGDLYRYDFRSSYVFNTGGANCQGFKPHVGPASDTVKVLNNRIEETDGRFGTATGGYDPSPFGQGGSRFGAAPGHITAHAIFYNGHNYNAPWDGTTDTPNAEIAYNEVIGTPGLALAEDVGNLYAVRGAPSSFIRIHDNLWRNTYSHWPELQNAAQFQIGAAALRYENQPAPGIITNITLTAAAAGGAGVLNCTATNFGVRGGTVLTFTPGGQTATVNGDFGPGTTAFNVFGLAAAIASGAVATWQVDLDYYSGTALICDGDGGETDYKRHAAYHEYSRNVMIGPGAFMSIDYGYMHRAFGNEFWGSGHLPSVLNLKAPACTVVPGERSKPEIQAFNFSTTAKQTDVDAVPITLTAAAGLNAGTLSVQKIGQTLHTGTILTFAGGTATLSATAYPPASALTVTGPTAALGSGASTTSVARPIYKDVAVTNTLLKSSRGNYNTYAADSVQSYGNMVQPACTAEEEWRRMGRWRDELAASGITVGVP